ncbi:MAG TPA: GNAT family N-acetyltransferase [Rhizomicrobium sp.]|nr:GNAT family N-acetyltransferase [Rhizomicrobium sp.]
MIEIRPLTQADKDLWARFRHALWPEGSPEEHANDIARLVAGGDYWGFVATRGGDAAGFAEVAIRRYANGCESQPVAFLEGIWVEPRFRRQGIGGQLVTHVEGFVKALGFREIGSDALIGNLASHAAHEAWGFAETERVVYFRKSLGRGDR